MWWILVCLIVIAVVLVYLLSLPSGYRVTRSIVIAKPVDEVFTYVRNFSNWTAWSPWFLQEPTCKVNIHHPTEVGGTYAWDGTKIGAGNMQHKAILPNERIDLWLTFIRPFKSQAPVSWSFKSVEGGTEITWDIQATMPLPMRPFQKFIAQSIGFDFELGLALLRGKLDPSSEHPQLSFDGLVNLESQLYLSEKFEGTFEAMRAAMQKFYPALWQTVQKDPSRMVAKPAVAAYHKVKPLKGWTSMDMGIAVSTAQVCENSLMLNGGRYFQMTLRGNYQFLGCAWNAIQGQVRMQKLKIDKSRPALEIYQVNPMEATHSNNWVTLLCLPIK